MTKAQIQSVLDSRGAILEPFAASVLRFQKLPQQLADSVERWNFFLLPIFRIDRTVLALKLWPGVALEDSSVVVSNGRASTTVATTVTGSIPILCLHVTLGRELGSWMALREGWARWSGGLLDLDIATGGNGLQSLHSLLFDTDIIGRIQNCKLGSVDQERALYTAAVRLGPDPCHVQYRTFLQDLLEGSLAPLPADLSGFGVWEAAACVAGFMAAHLRRDTKAECAWAWAHRRCAGGTDYVGATKLVSHLPAAGIGCLLEVGALSETSGPWSVDFRMPSLRSIHAGGSSYNGASHLALAQLLRERNQLVESWATLTEANLHAHQVNDRAVMRSATRMAHELSVVAGWGPLAEHTARVLKHQEAV